MDFKPVLSSNELATIMAQGELSADVKKEQEYVNWADTISVVFPCWWGNAPAIFKGYIDRVLTNGFAYTYTPEGPQALIKNKNVYIYTTFGTPDEMIKQYGIDKTFDFTIATGIFRFCGFDVKNYEIFGGIMNREQGAKVLEKVKEVVKGM